MIMVDLEKNLESTKESIKNIIYEYMLNNQNLEPCVEILLLIKELEQILLETRSEYWRKHVKIFKKIQELREESIYKINNAS